jgi:hypothetical protein
VFAFHIARARSEHNIRKSNREVQRACPIPKLRDRPARGRTWGYFFSFADQISMIDSHRLTVALADPGNFNHWMHNGPHKRRVSESIRMFRSRTQEGPSERRHSCPAPSIPYRILEKGFSIKTPAICCPALKSSVRRRVAPDFAAHETISASQKPI